MEKHDQPDTMFQRGLFADKSRKYVSPSHIKLGDDFDSGIYTTTFDVPEPMLIDKEDPQVYQLSCKYEPLPVNDSQNYSQLNVTHFAPAFPTKHQSHEGKVRPTCRLYVCEKCNASFRRLALLINHSKKHSNGPPYSCNDCSSIFEFEDDWFDHRETGCHVNDTKKTQKPRYLNAKQCKRKRGSGGKPFSCRHCSQTFKTAGARNDHERNIHKKLRPYSCGKCGKTFYKKFNLSVHMQVHSSDRPHKCHICSKKFKSPLHVKVHMKLHTDDRPFECQVCGKEFKTQAILDTHGSVHSQESKFHCNLCGKSYRYRASLFLHQRTHKKQRPYQCGECGATFMVKSHLTEHFRIHTGERPFHCEFCFSSFPRTHGLKKHLISHIRAGLDVDLEAVLYQAKLKANVKPRGPLVERNKQHTAPRNLCDSANNVIVLKSEEVLSHPIFEDSNMYPIPTLYEDVLVIVVVSRTGDGSTCSHTITRLSPVGGVLQGTNNMNEICVEKKIPECITHSQENYFKGNAVLINNLPVIISNDTVCHSVENSNYTGEDNTADQIQYTDMESRDDSSEPEINVINFTDVGGVGISSPNYFETRGNSQLEAIIEDSDDVVLLDNGLKSLLFKHKKISVECVADDLCHIVDQPNSRVLVIQPQDTKMPDDSLSIDESKHSRKPLKKCRYCDTSYRYLALLEAHEANHELKDRLKGEREAKTVVQDEHAVNKKSYSSQNVSSGDNLPFKCNKCGLSFSFRSELRKHEKLHSFRYHYTCKKCNQAFQYESFLAKHLCEQSVVRAEQNTTISSQKKNDCEQKEHKCSKCGKVFKKNFILRVHYRKHTGERPFVCHVCHDSFISATHCRVHCRIHTGQKPHKCQACGQLYRRRSALHLHTKVCRAIIPKETQGARPSAAINSVMQCERYTVGTNKVIRDTALVYNSSGIYLVSSPHDNCIKQMSITINPEGIEDISATTLEDNIGDDFNMYDAEENLLVKEDFNAESITSKQSYDMQVSEEKECEKNKTKSSKSVPSLRDASSRSPKSKKNAVEMLQCGECPKTFRFYSLLLAHERSHSGEKPFQCKVCMKAFSRKSNLTTHLKIHTDERPYVCNQCDKCFKYKYTLKVHQRCHTKVRPFLCDICGKKFRHAASRYVHLKRHAGEKAFSCNVCDKAFVTNIDLVYHSRTHTGEKPYQCHLCQRRFSVQHHLTKHKRCHAGEKLCAGYASV